MNSPSPNTPQGSTPEQKQQGRKKLFVAFFTIVGVNALCLVLALFIQGCKRQPAAEQQPPVDAFAVGSTDTNTIDASATNDVPGTIATEASNAVHHAEQIIQQQIPSTPPPPMVSEHTIVKGDTLGAIAKQYKVSLSALKAANPTINEKSLQIGKKLVIPAPTAVAETTTPSATTETVSGETTHTVKSGDTLGALATKYKTTVQAIQDLNGKKDTRIIVGEKLKIPAPKTATP